MTCDVAARRDAIWAGVCAAAEVRSRALCLPYNEKI